VYNHGHYGRWAFAEFTDVYEMQSDFEAKVEAHFNEIIDGMIDAVAAEPVV
jgi:type III restriction enzyme